MKYWVRGVSRIAAAATGVLLIYGIDFALEGMTKRIPDTPLHGLFFATLWMLPWVLLFCSGIEDFGMAAHQEWVFWPALILPLILLCYLELYTSDSALTKASMPLLATAGGSLPHVIQRVHFVFTIFSLAAGIAGFSVICFYLFKFLSGSMSSFANGTIGFLFFTFVITSLTTAILSLPSVRRRRTQTA